MQKNEMKHEFDHGTIYHGDCLELMRTLPEHSIDMILADLPYGTTDCKWDSIIPLDKLWIEYKRIIKETGSILFTAQQPFSSFVVCSNVKWYRHQWIWEKDHAPNFQCLKGAPYKITEAVLVFQERGYIRPWNDSGTPKGKYNP